MLINIFYTKLKQKSNAHKALKSLFIIALSQQLKSKFNVDKLQYFHHHWIYPNLFFSASHCQNHLIVAISKKPVGIDLELTNNSLLNKKLWKRITTHDENKKYSYSQLNLLMLWTKKEAIFKMSGSKSFIPDRINTLAFNTKTFMVDKKLLCSLAISK